MTTYKAGDLVCITSVNVPYKYYQQFIGSIHEVLEVDSEGVVLQIPTEDGNSTSLWYFSEVKPALTIHI